MQRAILDRAAKVRFDREYLGFLEWVVWGHLHGWRVDMMFGTVAVEVLAWFAPTLGRADESQPWKTARVAAVRLGARPGQWLAPLGHMPRINHYVIGVPTKRNSAFASSDGAAAGGTPRCADAALDWTKGS